MPDDHTPSYMLRDVVRDILSAISFDVTLARQLLLSDFNFAFDKKFPNTVSAHLMLQEETFVMPLMDCVKCARKSIKYRCIDCKAPICNVCSIPC